MIEQNNLTLEEIEKILGQPRTHYFFIAREDGEDVSGDWHLLARQLANVMRENERLRNALKKIDEMENDAPIDANGALFYAHQFAHAQNIAEEALKECGGAV